MSEVTEIIGVYNADGGVLGEVKYVLGKTFSSTHCALCDVTHSGVRKKREWVEGCESSTVPVRMVHLNERDETEVKACTLGTPTVLLKYADGTVKAVLGPEELEVNGSVSEFFKLVQSKLRK